MSEISQSAKLYSFASGLSDKVVELRFLRVFFVLF